MNAGGAVMWRRSSRCDTQTCVEVARTNGGVLLRDAKDPAGPVLAFSQEAWISFAAGVAEGEFDLETA